MVAVPRVGFTLEQCWHRVPGGTAVSALGAAAALAARDDVEVTGVAARHREPAPDPWNPPVPVRHLALPRRALYETWHALRWPSVRRATGELDLVHATTFAIPPRDVPLVVTVHDLAFLHEPSHFTRHGLRFFRRGLALTRRCADLVTVPSEATRRDCLDHGFAEDRVRVVPWGVDARPAAAHEVEQVRQRYDLPARYVLWTGTVEPRKNLRTLLRAWGRREREDVGLVLVGPEGWNESLADLAGSGGRDPRWLGFVPEQDLRALYAGAEVFCYPSLEEGFGLPVLEAMAQGTPVVTSVGTATAELGAGVARLVEPRDADAVEAALAGILDDPTEAARMGRAGVARAQDYSWARTASLLVSVYREALR